MRTLVINIHGTILSEFDDDFISNKSLYDILYEKEYTILRDLVGFHGARYIEVSYRESSGINLKEVTKDYWISSLKLGETGRTSMNRRRRFIFKSNEFYTLLYGESSIFDIRRLNGKNIEYYLEVEDEETH